MVAAAKIQTFKSPPQLLEDYLPVKLTLDEGRGDGKLIMRGEFARANVATENKRLYRDTLWERELQRLDRALSERRVFGETDHPSDGRTQLQRVSHLVTGLSLENGLVIGEAEIIDTQRGRDLKAILESGARVGVSSRGYGSTVTNEKGEEVVQEDYRLVTFDFVAEPANVTSYPERVKAKEEEKENEMAIPEKKREQESQKIENAPTDVKEPEKIREEEKAKLVADPVLASSKAALEQILDILKAQSLPRDVETVCEPLVKAKDEEIAQLKTALTERDQKIATLEEEVEQISSVAREVGYKFFLESQLSGSEDSDMLRSMVGEVRQFESSDQIKTKLQECKKELARRKVKFEQDERRRRRELEVLESDKDQFQSRLKKTEEALEKAVELNQALALELHTQNRLANHPKARDLRESLKRLRLTSKQEIDEVIDDSTKTPLRDAEQLEEVRSRVRSLTNGGFNSTPLDEEQGPSGPRAKNSSDYNGLGVSLAELRALAEISN